MTIHRTLTYINKYYQYEISTHCLVCLILPHTILRTSKSIGNNTMKKCYSSYCAGPVWQDVLNRRLLFKTTGSSSTKGNHHPSFSVSGNWAEEKLSMQPKFVAAQKMLLKQNPANIPHRIARFITLGIYTPLEVRVLLTIIAWGQPMKGNSICTAH